jgi:photosystem II stability/assembly factor-like uncharacterized protein
MDLVPKGEENNFYSIQKAFNDYWKDRNTKEKGKGWKPFKRWEWYWEQRVYPTGRFPDRYELYDEYRRVTERRKSAAPIGPTANWTEMGPSTSPGGYSGIGRLNCVRTDPGNPDVIWVGSASGGLWKSTDAGTTWASNTDTLLSLGITDIAIDPANTNTMFIATGDGDASDDFSIGVLKSTDGGMTWQSTGLSWQTSQGSLLSRLLMHPDDPNTLIAAGSGIHKTTDGGATWVQTSSVRIHDLEFKPGDPGTLYAAGAASNIYRSTDGGDSWVSMTNGFPSGGRRVALGVTPANPAYVYALVSNASSGFLGLYRSTDSGDSWSVRSTSPNILGWEVNGSDAGGQGWYDLAIAVSPADAEEIFTGGVNNWKSTNGGTSWSISSMWYFVPGIAEVHADQHDLYFAPGTDILFVGNDGGVYRTTDVGATWSWLGEGLRITQFYRFGTSQTDPDRVIAGAQDNGTKMGDNGAWSDELGGDGMEALIDYTDANIMYGELYYGDIYRSMNGGGSWQAATGGITESGGWITPYVIDPVNPATLYAGFAHVWKTTNRGVTWSIASNFAASTLSILAVAPSDPNVIYAGTGGSLYRTTDGGATNWTSVPRPVGSGSTTSIAIHQTDPHHIWLTSSGYIAGQKVYESTDGGSTWTNISGSLPNIPVNCVVYQNFSPNRVYVGTDMGIYYRDATTADWQEYSTGLANVSITELEIQYATNRIRACTYGRGVWESDAVLTSGAVLGIAPSLVDFGRHEVGSTSDTVTLSMTNYGTVDSLTITSITLGGSPFMLTSAPSLPLVIPPQGTATAEIQFAPVAYGASLDTLMIESNSTAGSPASVGLSGWGVEIGQAVSGVMYAANDSLYTVDPGTGAVTLLGGTGLGELQSLTVRPTTLELYGASADNLGTTIYRVSSAHGDALPVQTFPTPYVRAIAFSPNDTLYGAAAFGADFGKLFRLDLSSGQAEEIGSAGIVYSSLAFDPASGDLWASERPVVGTKDRIYRVNTSTGTATLVGQTGFNLRITAAIAFDQMAHLYGVTGSGQQTNEFIQIDTGTAAGTLIGPMGTTSVSAMTMRVDSVVLGVIPDSRSGIPATFVLEQNYPNPFNPSTEIRYGLPRASRVTLTVYNILGQEIVRLVDEVKDAGYHTAIWTGKDEHGRNVSSGVYLFKLEAASTLSDFTSIRKMILLK